MNTVYPGDIPNHEISQNVRIDTFTSSDPDFNDIEQVVYGQNDSVARSGTQRGYSRVIHKNGDESYRNGKEPIKRPPKKVEPGKRLLRESLSGSAELESLKT